MKLAPVLCLILGLLSSSLYAKEVSHALGTTDVPDRPMRIAVLTNEGTEALLALGITPIAAVKSWSGFPWYAHISKEMHGVTVLGTESQVNIEQLAWAKPDLILANKQRHAAIAPLLNTIAPTVFSEALRDHWKENFKLYAKATSKEPEAKLVLEQYQQEIQALRKELGSNLNERISVIRFQPSEVRIYQQRSFSGTILRDIGFKRPEIQLENQFALTHVGREQIPSFAGDRIFVLVYGGSHETHERVSQWTKSPFWQELAAVKQDKVYWLSDTTWNTSGGILSAFNALEDVKLIYRTETTNAPDIKP